MSFSNSIYLSDCGLAEWIADNSYLSVTICFRKENYAYAFQGKTNAIFDRKELFFQNISCHFTPNLFFFLEKKLFS